MNRQALLKKFKQLEDARLKLLNEVKHIEHVKLLRKPAPDKWSVVQILYHLHLTESRSLGYVNKKILGGHGVRKTGIAANIRSLWLKVILLSGYKWKAPPILGDVPEGLIYDVVIDSWHETRKEIKSLIASLPEKMFDREIYRHPVAGRMNLIQMMHFFQDHFDHHLAQVRRLLK